MLGLLGREVQEEKENSLDEEADGRVLGRKQGEEGEEHAKGKGGDIAKRGADGFLCR